MSASKLYQINLLTLAQVSATSELVPRATLPHYLANGIIQVCSYCYPGQTIYSKFPLWTFLGLEISHGACKECQQAILGNMRKPKAARMDERLLHQILLKVPLAVAQAGSYPVTFRVELQ